MSNHFFTLTPRDVLFMHDARPMEASDAGLGANWPRPDQLWNALINMFHRQWPKLQSWEGDEHTYRAGIDDHSDSSFRFGALQTVGPFPMKEDDGKTTLFFPCPLDLSTDSDGNLQPMELVSADGTDMPKPLKYAFQAPVLGKQQLPPWLSEEDYKNYLNGETIEKPKEEKPCTADRNIGIAIDPETGTTGDGKLYQAEYLRLAKDITMAFSASCDIRAKNRKDAERYVDVFKKMALPADVVIGGQQGIARLKELKSGLNLPQAEPRSDSLKVRWTLLSPLVSTAGWLPSWIDEKDGKVMLKVKTEREPNEPREKWRERLASSPEIKARLVAARIGKPIAFSGWDLQAGDKASAGVPKKTLLAVPAGSCYVFECESFEDVKNLWKALDGKRLSSVHGEKGFGFGVCSSI